MLEKVSDRTDSSQDHRVLKLHCQIMAQRVVTVRRICFNMSNPDDHLIVDNPCKRKSESVPTSSNKKARSQSRQTREGSPVEDLGFWINVPTNAQTAYYAIERLRSSWEFTHATGIYISGIFQAIACRYRLIIEFVVYRNRVEHTVVRRGGVYRVDSYRHHPTPSPPGRFLGRYATVQTVTWIR